MPSSDIPKTAMVLAAGLGTRMRPITNNMPKVLVKVNGKALIDYTLDKLAEAGVLRAVVNTHYFAEMVAQHLSGRTSPEIIISHESPIILDSGGGVVNALPLLGKEPFYLLNSDMIWTENAEEPALLRLAAAWNPDKMDALLLLARLDTAIGFDGKGDFDLLPDGMLKRHSGSSHEFVNAGVIIIKPEVFAGIGSEPFSIFRDLLFKLEKYNRSDGAMPRLYGIVHEGKWLHVGTPDAIKLAEDELLEVHQ